MARIHHQQELNDLQSVTLNNRKNELLTFVRNNNYKISLNRINNWMWLVTNIVKKTWINLSRDCNNKLWKDTIIKASLIELLMSYYARNLFYYALPCPINVDSLTHPCIVFVHIWYVLSQNKQTNKQFGALPCVPEIANSLIWTSFDYFWSKQYLWTGKVIRIN